MNIIQESCLKIEDNKLSYKKSFIQLSNISQAFVEKEEKKTYSILAFLGCMVGITLSTNIHVMWVGISILVLSLLFLLPTFISNRKKKYILVLVTNSGWKAAFRCKEESFLIEVLELIKNKISDHSNYVINLEECTITNSQIGERNVMSVT